MKSGVRAFTERVCRGGGITRVCYNELHTQATYTLLQATYTLLEEAKAGHQAVFFVDAAHFVHRASTRIHLVF